MAVGAAVEVLQQVADGPACGESKAWAHPPGNAGALQVSSAVFKVMDADDGIFGQKSQLGIGGGAGPVWRSTMPEC